MSCTSSTRASAQALTDSSRDTCRPQVTKLLEGLDADGLVLPGTLDDESLATSLAALRSDPRPSSRALIVCGAGESFCLGIDLDQAFADVPRTDPKLLAGLYRDLLLELRQCARPTIAWVDGDALGAGVGLASVCDVVIATNDARFGLPETLWGVFPAMVLPCIRERLSPHHATRLALEASSITAKRAAAWGLVDRVVDSGQRRRALASAIRRLARAEPGARAALKRYSAELSGLPATLEAAADLAGERFGSESIRALAAARLRAFRDGGEPAWL